MALPMVHLLVAHAWARDKENLLNNPDYYLGAISPDAIHIRDGNDKSRKNEIHLNNWIDPHPDEVLKYWQAHSTAFDIGYGIHVLTDSQWVRRFHERLPQIMLPNGKPDPELYYNDTCITDFELYAQSALTPFLMDQVKKGRVPKDHPLLSAYEIDQWREETFRFYQRPCPKSDPVRYLTLDYVRDFMNDCEEMFDETYRRFKMMNETQLSILNRRSTRGFSETALKDDEIHALLDAALASPSARNYQDWHFSFVKNRALLDEFSEAYRQIMLKRLPSESRAGFESKHFHLFFHAPLVVWITLPEAPNSRFSQVDAGIAVENLALSAQGMGLGSVIVGMPKDLFASDSGAAWERRMGFPSGHHFAIGIAIGHPTVQKEAHRIAPEKYTIIE